MARESLFERMEREIDLTKELIKIDQAVYSLPYSKRTTINDIFEIDFTSWKFRSNYLTLNELREELKLDWKFYGNNENVDLNTFLIYCELVINLSAHIINKRNARKEVLDIIFKTINVDMEKMNFEFHTCDDDKIIVVEKNAAVTAVADLVEDNLADQIIEYNHYLMRGDLVKKKRILLALSHKIEPQKKQLTAINKALSDRLFCLFNSVNIRHNNKEEGKYYQEYVDQMDDATIEQWYDDTYQTALFAILSLEQAERNKKIDELKSHLSN